MEVYHASTMVVESPDTTHSRAFLDFGPGFYVTTLQDQAVKYGARFTYRGKEAFLNTYELAVDLYFAGDISKEECLRRLIFEEPNNQICIRSQQVLNECLTFKSSQRL